MDNLHLVAPSSASHAICKMARSPSHESITSDVSLFSTSTAPSDTILCRRLIGCSKPNVTGARGNSPIHFEHRSKCRPLNIPEVMWLEEEPDLIRNCAALCTAAGLQKSFSTNDITQLPEASNDERGAYQLSISELALDSLPNRVDFYSRHPRFDQTSRSCSTWVAVGDMPSTSQLPSPHGGQQDSIASTASATTVTATPPPPSTNPSFTAVDFIRSVNKKVRQDYIRRRLLTTYKALERLSQSEFNLDRLEEVLHPPHPKNNENAHLPIPQTQITITEADEQPSNTDDHATGQTAVQFSINPRLNRKLPLTIRDVERERGKPLSKYERNMMIFNWLHNLDDSAYVEGIQ